MTNGEAVDFCRIARKAVSIPSKHGHSDVGDVFTRLLKEELSFGDALDELFVLMETYEKDQTS